MGWSVDWVKGGWLIAVMVGGALAVVYSILLFLLPIFVYSIRERCLAMEKSSAGCQAELVKLNELLGSKIAKRAENEPGRTSTQ